MDATQPVRIAMWSGPRNISTALLRAWGQRPDTFVCDEPLYAHYLQQTGLPHPGREEVIASQDTDWRRVTDWLTQAAPQNKAIFYQKHMSHHLLPDMGREWLKGLVNCFLIREPGEMLTSLVKATPDICLADTGLPQQCEIFDLIRRHTGHTPPVLDARDVLTNPESMLSQLCAAVGVPFTSAMLSWPAGRRATDGVWAKHWYAAVEASTGFQRYRPKDEPLNGLEPLYRECLPYYERLYEVRLLPP